MTKRKYLNPFPVIAILATILCFLFLGFITWHNTKSVAPQIDTALKSCLERLDQTNPNPQGLSDHRDKSECNPKGVVAYDSLSQEERDTSRKNINIRNEAIKQQSVRKCLQIKGKIYTPYPANLNKVMIDEESSSRIACISAIRDAIKTAAKKREKEMRTFILPRWEISLTRPTTIDEVKYYKVTADSNEAVETYEFTTRHAETTGNCTKNKQGIQASLRAISRTKATNVTRPPIDSIYLGTIVGEYYYFDTRPRIPCYSNTHGGIDEGREVETMLREIRAPL